jgi:lysophospholipase L1-like esterase
VCIHLLLALALIKPNFIERIKKELTSSQNEITAHYKTMLAYHLRIDGNLPPNMTYFIGDSHIQGLATAAVSPHTVNYGIGNDTTVGVLHRVTQYKSLKNGNPIILAIGFNDLRYRDNKVISENIQKILGALPDNSQIILCALIPVGKQQHETYNRRITKLNESLKEISAPHRNVAYLDSFYTHLSPDKYLPEDYLLKDGIHLSKKGYDLWISKLRQTINYIEGTH